MIGVLPVTIDRRADGTFTVTCGPPSRRRVFDFADHAAAVRFAESKLTRQNFILDQSMQSPEQRAERLAREARARAIASTILGSG